MRLRIREYSILLALVCVAWTGPGARAEDIDQFRNEYNTEVRKLQDRFDKAARNLQRSDGTVDTTSAPYKKLQENYNAQKQALRERFNARHPAKEAWDSLQKTPSGKKLTSTGSNPSSSYSDMDVTAADPGSAKAAADHLRAQGHDVTYDPELGMYLDHSSDVKIWEPGTPQQQTARANNPEGYTRSGSMEHEGIDSPNAQYDPEGYVEDLNKKYEAAKKAGDTRTMNKVARKMQEAMGKTPDPVTQKMGVDADPYEAGEVHFGESDAVKKAQAQQRAEALDQQVQDARAEAKIQSQSNSKMRDDLSKQEQGLGNQKSAKEYKDANGKIEKTTPTSGESSGSSSKGGQGPSSSDVTQGGAGDVAGDGQAGVETDTGGSHKGGDAAGGEGAVTGSDAGKGGAAEAGGVKSGDAGMSSVDTSAGSGHRGRGASQEATGGETAGAGEGVVEGGAGETGASGSGETDVGGKSVATKSGEPGATDTASTGGRGAAAGESGAASDGVRAGDTGGGAAAHETTGVTDGGGSGAGETAGGPRTTESGGGAAVSETGGPKVSETGGRFTGPEPGAAPQTGKGAPAAEGPGVVGKGMKAVGDAMEVVTVINQAGKVHEGIKEGDINKVAAGVAGEDAVKTAQVQGGKEYNDAMDQLLDAKTAEAQAAAEGKLKRMGATPEEIKQYHDSYDKDPGAARAIVQTVKDRGGADTKPQQGLEGAGPEESSWNAKDQLTDGAKQAHSYVDAASMGGLGHTENAVSDVFDITKCADAVDDSTKAEQLSKMYTDLRMRGASKDEANKALENYYKDPKAFRDLVQDLRERDPEKFDAATGKHAKDLGNRGNVDVVADDTVGDRAGGVGHDLKTGLIDEPQKAVQGILGDITGDNQETEGILNDATKRGKEGAEIRDKIYHDLVARGASDAEARAAVNDLAHGDRSTLHGLVGDLGERGQAGESTSKTDDGKGGKGAFAPKEPVTSDRTPPEDAAAAGSTVGGEDKSGADTGAPVVWGTRNDAGEAVDAGAYNNGDRIVNKDGTEFVNQDGRWVETGNNYGAYDSTKDGGSTAKDGTGRTGGRSETGRGDGSGSSEDLADSEAGMPEPDADAGAEGSDSGDRGGVLDGFAGSRDASTSAHTSEGMGMMKGSARLSQASTAGDQQVADAKQTINRAGDDYNTSRSQSSSDVSADDRANSWGNTLGNSVQQGVEQGVSQAGAALGSAAADHAGSQIFDHGGKGSPPTSDTGCGTADASDTAAGGGTVAGGTVAGPTGGGDAGGAGCGSDATGSDGGQVSAPVPPSSSGGCTDGDHGAGMANAGGSCSSGSSCSSGGSGKGGGGAGGGGTVTCNFCGHTEVVPPGGTPPAHCPVCGCGPGMALVTCSFCGHRWLVPESSGPPGSCPACGKGGKVTPDDSGGSSSGSGYDNGAVDTESTASDGSDSGSPEEK